MNEVAMRYDRISKYYDLAEAIVETRLFSKWRTMLWKYPKGKILEVGIGTGKNIPYYPETERMIGIDISKGMLEFARKKTQSLDKSTDLMVSDVESLPLRKETFDCVVSTFVFCSVPHPIKGLREIYRVLKSRGKVYLLEHVLSENKLIRFCEKIHNPLTSRMLGFNVNRETRKNLETAGFKIIEDREMAIKDVFRFFIVGKDE